MGASTCGKNGSAMIDPFSAHTAPCGRVDRARTACPTGWATIRICTVTQWRRVTNSIVGLDHELMHGVPYSTAWANCQARQARLGNCDDYGVGRAAPPSAVVDMRSAHS